MNKINLTSLLLFLLLTISGCSGMLQDIFVGNTPSDEEAWHKKGMTQKSQTEDFSKCFKLAKSKYNIGDKDNIGDKFNELYDFNQECLLAKGYKFYPRGLDGKKASRCRSGDADGPACKSRRFFNR